MNHGKPSGWYPDPEDPTRLRRWDGVGWTDSWKADPDSPLAVGGPGSAAATPAGWHPDPYRPATERLERFWDGTTWTPRVRLVPWAGRVALGRGFFTLAGWVQGLLVAQVAVAAVTAFSGLWVVTVVGRWIQQPDLITEAEAVRIDTIALALENVRLVLAIACGVLFFAWLRRAYRSDRVDPATLRHSAAWAVGSWFVPFLNLIRPFQIVTDLRQGARSAHGAANKDRHRRLVPLWWAAFLTMWVLRSISNVQARSTQSLEGIPLLENFRAAAWIGVAISVATMAAAALAVAVVRDITGNLRPRELHSPVPATTAAAD